MSSHEQKIVYFDNNATTLMSDKVINSLVEWCNRGNPSADYASAREAKQMMNDFRSQIAIECGFELDGPNAFAIIFNSGASESNCHIVTSAVRSYAAKTKKLPHLITSAAEHKSLLSCCVRLEKEKLCQLTILPVGSPGSKNLGSVDPNDLARAIRPNTCLVSIMAANNETGILNNLREMSKTTKKAHIPFHTDAVQLFGKSAVRPILLGIDAFSASFHKLGGPPGVGILVIKKSLIDGYDLCSHICGSQNDGMRGGTENLPGIGASFTAFRFAMTDRTKKTLKVSQLKTLIKEKISAIVPCFYIDDYPTNKHSIDGGITQPSSIGKVTETPEVKHAISNSIKKRTPVIFWIAPKDDLKVLPNTLLIAVHKTGFCNKIARSNLEKKGIIVSIGAACNTSSADKGVIIAVNIQKSLRPGVLRISLSDNSTVADVELFVFHFIAVITA